MDGTAEIVSLDPLGDDNWWLRLRVPPELIRYIVSKASVAVDGISLTVAKIEHDLAEFTIIPQTYSHTALASRGPARESIWRSTSWRSTLRSCWQSVPKLVLYSCLSDTSGSTRAAFRAGIHEAANAVAVRRTVTAPKVVGSVGFTSKSRFVIKRVSPKATPSPAPIPASTIVMPCQTIMRAISPPDAPTAARTPISCLRWLTE